MPFSPRCCRYWTPLAPYEKFTGIAKSIGVSGRAPQVVRLPRDSPSCSVSPSALPPSITCSCVRVCFLLCSRTTAFNSFKFTCPRQFSQNRAYSARSSFSSTANAPFTSGRSTVSEVIVATARTVALALATLANAQEQGDCTPQPSGGHPSKPVSSRIVWQVSGCRPCRA